MEITVQVTGLDELIRKVKDPELLGTPLRGFFTQSTLTLQADAQKLTPVDTGRLRASETTLIDSAPIPLWGEVGTNVIYAPFVEDNTRPHFPPTLALQGWANRHGINVFVLARAISRRGTRGKHMFMQSFNKNKETVLSYLKDAARDIETIWERK